MIKIKNISSIDPWKFRLILPFFCTSPAFGLRRDGNIGTGRPLLQGEGGVRGLNG